MFVQEFIFSSVKLGGEAQRESGSGSSGSFLKVQRTSEAAVLVPLPELGKGRPGSAVPLPLGLGARRGPPGESGLHVGVGSPEGDFVVDRHVREIRAEAAEPLRVSERIRRSRFPSRVRRPGSVEARVRVAAGPAPVGASLVPDGSFLDQERRSALLRCLGPLLERPPPSSRAARRRRRRLRRLAAEARLSGGRGLRRAAPGARLPGGRRGRRVPELGRSGGQRGCPLRKALGESFLVESGEDACGCSTRAPSGHQLRQRPPPPRHSLCRQSLFPGFPLTGVSSTLAMAASLLAALIIFFSALRGGGGDRETVSRPEAAGAQRRRRI